MFGVTDDTTFRSCECLVYIILMFVVSLVDWFAGGKPMQRNGCNTVLINSQII